MELYNQPSMLTNDGRGELLIGLPSIPSLNYQIPIHQVVGRQLPIDRLTSSRV